MKRDSRRLFSTVEHLGKINPIYLIRLAHKFPDDFRELIASGAIPTESEADKLDLAKLVPLLTNRGVSEELGEALFMITAFSTPHRRKILEREVELSIPRVVITVDEDTTDADYAILTWLTRPILLESAVARVTLTSKRAFFYYISKDLAKAASAPAVTDAMIERLARQLQAAFSKYGTGRGFKIIPYLDRPEEDWFLIRHAALPERISYIDEKDEQQSITVRATSYDVVVFDRTTGLLKVNSNSRKEETYRQAFSDAYFRDITFFAKENIFSLESFRSNDTPVISVPGIQSVDLSEVSYLIYEELEPTEYVKKRKNYYKTNLSRTPPVPEDSHQINHAKLKIHFADRREAHSVQVYSGNQLVCSRDESSDKVEEFLRQAGIMINVEPLVKAHAA